MSERDAFDDEQEHAQAPEKNDAPADRDFPSAADFDDPPQAAAEQADEESAAGGAGVMSTAAEPEAAPEAGGGTAGEEELDVKVFKDAAERNKKPASGTASPEKLKKNVIVAAAAAIIGLVLILTTMVPEFTKKKPKQTAREKTDASAIQGSNYRAMAPRKPNKETEELVFQPEEIVVEPPKQDMIAPKYHYQEPQPQTVTGGGGSGGNYPTRPYTKEDRLQSKTITGIKGLTPTQQQYATADYRYSNPQTPIAANASAANANNPYAKYGLPSKEDMINQVMAAAGMGTQAQQTQPYAGVNTPYNAQNDKGSKMSFYNQGRENTGNGVWLGEATIWQGTIFPATLLSAVNTDLPGEAVAMITKNIYYSLDGRLLLIPQNTRLFGTYNSSISYSQSRVQVGLHTLIRPDGFTMNLGNMQATDKRGAAGLRGIINDHPFEYIKALGLISAFRILTTELNNSTAALQNQYVQNLVADSQNIIATFSQKLIDRAMDVQQSITIRAGTTINVVVSNTLALPPLDPYPVTAQYRR